MSQVQSGILPEHCRAAIWIEANVKGEIDSLRAGSKIFADKVATVQAQFPDAQIGAVVAFGHTVWRTLSGGEGAQVIDAVGVVTVAMGDDDELEQSPATRAVEVGHERAFRAECEPVGGVLDVAPGYDPALVAAGFRRQGGGPHPQS